MPKLNPAGLGGRSFPALHHLRESISASPLAKPGAAGCQRSLLPGSGSSLGANSWTCLIC